MDERLEIRVYEGQLRPRLIYLPGLHGDWTLIGEFRKAVTGRAGFVEFIYPRTLTWSLTEYAEAIEVALREQGIGGGWLLAESFGSQIAWELVKRGRLPWRGVILAGGFARYPMMWGVRLAAWITGRLSEKLLRKGLQGYSKALHLRYRNSPEVLAAVNAFLARRTDLDRRAALHRLRLIAGANPADSVRDCRIPVYALSGFFDPIVPWMLVRPWLRKHCRSLKGQKIIWRADHTVLATGARPAAAQILEWISTAGPAPA